MADEININSLSDSSISAIRRLIRGQRTTPLPARPPHVERPTHDVPHYIAQTGVDGIPGRDGDEYAFADCDLFRLNPATKELEQLAGKVRVFNYSVGPIPAEKKISVHVDAWGNFIAEPWWWGTVLFKAPSGGIPARSGTTSGTASCDLILADYTDTGFNITVRNWSTSVVCSTGDRYGWAQLYDDSFFVIAEDCG